MDFKKNVIIFFSKFNLKIPLNIHHEKPQPLILKFPPQRPIQPLLAPVLIPNPFVYIYLRLHDDNLVSQSKQRDSGHVFPRTRIHRHVSHSVNSDVIGVLKKTPSWNQSSSGNLIRVVLGLVRLIRIFAGFLGCAAQKKSEGWF